VNTVEIVTIVINMIRLWRLLALCGVSGVLNEGVSYSEMSFLAKKHSSYFCSSGLWVKVCLKVACTMIVLHK
jgi:hypothetical protein